MTRNIHIEVTAILLPLPFTHRTRISPKNPPFHPQKINSFIDQKTAWVDHLDKSNIAKNKAHGIEPPKDAVSSISHIISDAIGSKLQKAGPIISLVTSKIAGGSSGGHGAGFNLKGFLGGSSGGAHAGASAYGV